MTINRDIVKRVARLARLHVSEEKQDLRAKEISSILDWIEQLQAVNTDGVEPMRSVFLTEMPSRDDVVNDGDQVEAVLANAPDAAFNMFAVPKVIE